jgi:phosphatidylinositol glycan class Q protein
MHPASILTLLVFGSGYVTARWDLVAQLIELAQFAWDHSVVVRTSDLFQHLYAVLTRSRLGR